MNLGEEIRRVSKTEKTEEGSKAIIFQAFNTHLWRTAGVRIHLKDILHRTTQDRGLSIHPSFYLPIGVCWTLSSRCIL